MAGKRKSDAKGGSGQEPEAGSAPEQEAVDITGGVGAADIEGKDDPVPGEAGPDPIADGEHGSDDDASRSADQATEVSDENADPASDDDQVADAALDQGEAAGGEEEAQLHDANVPGADAAELPPEEPAVEEAGEQEAAADDHPSMDEQVEVSGNSEPDPDAIATTAMLAAGAAYYRAVRLADDVADGIDLGWIVDDFASETPEAKKVRAERAVVELAAFCRKVKGGNRAAMAMHMKLGRFRSSGEASDQENVAFDTFAAVLATLDQFAERQAQIARDKHKTIPRVQPIDIEETTLELVDDPMAMDDLRPR